MGIAPEDVESVLPLAVVPLALSRVFISIRPEGPISGDELVRGALDHFRRLHGTRLRGSSICPGITGDVLDAEGFDGPDGDVTVTPGLGAGSGAFGEIIDPEGIAFVGWAVVGLDGGHVDIEGTVVVDGIATVEGHGSGGASECSPIVVGWVKIVVIIGVHGEGDAMLTEVVVAFDGAGLLFRPSQGGKEHSSKNRDNRDDNQQFDEGESEGVLECLFHAGLFTVVYKDWSLRGRETVLVLEPARGDWLRDIREGFG